MDLQNQVTMLFRQGNSLTRIAKLLGKSKGGVYPYYLKLKGKTYRIPIPVTTYSVNEGEIVGIFAGDGWFTYYKPKGEYKGYIAFGKQNIHYANYVTQLYSRFFRRNLQLITDNDKTLKLRMTSKITYDYFCKFLAFDRSTKALTLQLKQINLPRKFLIGFLKGLIDTDGSITYRNTYPRIRFNTASFVLANQLQIITSRLGVQTRMGVDRRWKQAPTQKSPKLSTCYRIDVKSKKDNLLLANLVQSFKIKAGWPGLSQQPPMEYS